MWATSEATGCSQRRWKHRRVKKRSSLGTRKERGQQEKSETCTSGFPRNFRSDDIIRWIEEGEALLVAECWFIDCGIRFAFSPCPELHWEYRRRPFVIGPSPDFDQFSCCWEEIGKKTYLPSDVSNCFYVLYFLMPTTYPSFRADDRSDSSLCLSRWLFQAIFRRLLWRDLMFFFLLLLLASFPFLLASRLWWFDVDVSYSRRGIDFWHGEVFCRTPLWIFRRAPAE